MQAHVVAARIVLPCQTAELWRRYRQRILVCSNVSTTRDGQSRRADIFLYKEIQRYLRLAYRLASIMWISTCVQFSDCPPLIPCGVRSPRYREDRQCGRTLGGRGVVVVCVKPEYLFVRYEHVKLPSVTGPVIDGISPPQDGRGEKCFHTNQSLVTRVGLRRGRESPLPFVLSFPQTKC